MHNATTPAATPQQILATLFITILLLVWLRHDALNTYWEQTRHQQSQLTPFSNSPLGQLGSRVDQGMQSPLSWVNEQIGGLNQRMTAASNILLHGVPETDESTTLPLSARQSADNRSDTSSKAPPALVASAPASVEGDGRLPLTAEDKVLFVGDSMMQGVAPHVVRKLQREYGISSIDASKQSTGLTYPSYFDWPKTVKTLVPKHGITTVVVFLGANDTWDMVLDGKYERFGNDKWQAAYQARINDLLSYAHEHQLKVVWLGAPAMGREKINAGVPLLNRLYAAGSHANGARFVPTNLVLGNRNGEFSKFSEEDGRRVALRSDDGVHFTRAGQVKLAELVLAQFRLPAAKSEAAQ